MSDPTQLLGFAAICFGTITFVLRLTTPAVFRKLKAMQQVYGPVGGYVVHTMSYSIIPIAVGIAMIIGGSVMR
ncbi:hypothetical protein AB1L30_22160 [Bremerella sp. JC817]|uniref:hypothetical protein n=1 Tax=Bremerella sp. JC817 TaxID=3231756 RepID=UPI00345B0338